MREEEKRTIAKEETVKEEVKIEEKGGIKLTDEQLKEVSGGTAGDTARGMKNIMWW